jgi:hypothetical protein
VESEVSAAKNARSVAVGQPCPVSRPSGLKISATSWGSSARENLDNPEYCGVADCSRTGDSGKPLTWK